jgi:glycosyltransferase involved in cell wall biosynthesis
MAEFTIVIPTYNNKAQLALCLNSIVQFISQDFKAIICDDGSKDGTVEFVNDFISKHPQFVLAEYPDKQNRGRSSNRNQAIPFIKTPFVLFLDSDAVLKSDILAEHAKILKANLNIVSLGGMFYTNTNTSDWAAYLSKRGTRKFNHLESINYKYLNSGNFAMQSSQFVRLGGFDEKFVVYGGEDMEFGFRIEKEFHPKFIVNTKASAYATMDKTLDKALEQYQDFGRINLKYIVKKHPECDNIFHAALFMNDNLKSKVFRLLLNDQVGKAFRIILDYCPNFLKTRLTSYLVALAIKKGLLASK